VDIDSFDPWIRPSDAFRPLVRTLSYFGLGLMGGLAAEMAGRRFDVIVAAWNPAIAAVRRTVASTPVVMVGAIDPVGNGFVSSTSRPGANMTGLMWDIGFTKQLDVLKEAVPKLSRVAVLRDPTGDWGPDYWREAEGAAALRGLTLVSVEIRRQEDLETAVRKLSREHPDAILIWDSLLFWRHSGVILGFARANRLPVMASSKEYVRSMWRWAHWYRRVPTLVPGFAGRLYTSARSSTEQIPLIYL
jgi:putative tryptophan/tyrosine transport system substrate-binding protein